MNFDRLDRYLKTLPADHLTEIYGCAVHLNGQEIFRAGTDSELDFFHFYSTTKLFTVTAAMQLVEQNRLSLFAPVADYLPAFSSLRVQCGHEVLPCRSPLLIWHLFTMSGGFDYNDDFPEMHELLDEGQPAGSGEILSLLAKRPLSFEPGTHYLYSLGIDILGAVVEKISGMTLDRYFERFILAPVGCRDITFFPSGSQYARMSEQYHSNDAGNELTPIGKQNYFYSARFFPSGGAGLCGTVNDYILFLDVLANRGLAPSGERILQPESVALICTPMLPSIAQKEYQVEHGTDSCYAMGVRTYIDPPGVGSFGWTGAAGSYAVADPEYGLSFFFASHVINYPTYYHTVHPEIRKLVYESLS